jgi:hypothetical protein
VRIAALWIHEKDGTRFTTGEITSDVGINLPPGMKLMCKIVRNEKKQSGDKLPDAYLEAWFPRPRTEGAAPEGSGEEGDDIPF